MSNRIGVFLQARLDSTRLPRKALLPIEGKAVIIHAMESLKGVKADCRVLLTDEKSTDELKPLAAECGFSVFTGPAEDVLKRFVRAAKEYEVAEIIRATGDNPLVDSTTAGLILSLHMDTGADYSGFDGPPIGTGVEVLKTEALNKAWELSTEQWDHEHVSPYLYKNPDKFKINRIMAPAEYCLEKSAVTIDTGDDYEYVRRLYRDLYEGSPLSIKQIIPWLLKNPRT